MHAGKSDNRLSTRAVENMNITALVMGILTNYDELHCAATI